MSDRSEPNGKLIARLSEAWLAAEAADEASPEWVGDQQLDWISAGNFTGLWHFVLRLCKDVSDEDGETIAQIGVDPLFNLVHEWPDEALTAVEAKAASHPTLLRALASVMPPTDVVSRRIDEIIARHGGGG